LTIIIRGLWKVVKEKYGQMTKITGVGNGRVEDLEKKSPHSCGF